MEYKEFKKIFNEAALKNGFLPAFGCWHKSSPECLAILELVKSNFGNYYQLLIKIYIQGVFGRTYSPDKDLMKRSMGHITADETQDYKSLLDFDEPMDDEVRFELLQKLFKFHIVPFTNQTLTRAGIKELSDKGIILLLPAVKSELKLK
jgi:hypothetical protein